VAVFAVPYESAFTKIVSVPGEGDGLIDGDVLLLALLEIDELADREALTLPLILGEIELLGLIDDDIEGEVDPVVYVTTSLGSDVVPDVSAG
jgi:hypothetical protein